jgi:hypothetical protein
MEAAITALLLGNASLTALAGTRIHWNRLPQDIDAKPYVVMFNQPGIETYTYAGPAGYVQQRVQVDVYGLTFTSALATARAAHTAVSGFQGTVAGTDIHLIEAERPGGRPAADAGDVTILARQSFDMIVHYRP